MADITTAFWGMTINNYDETELALVQLGYPDHMRELVYTLEEGENGTPHIQAHLKLKRQQRLSFVKRLFPRGHFKALTSSEYIENSKRYAQKLDATARSPAVHKFYDPVHTIEGVVKKVMLLIAAQMAYEEYSPQRLHQLRLHYERKLVWEDYTMAKTFVSATYKQMWKQFGEAMYTCVVEQFSAEKEQHTHTHTHSDEKFSRLGGKSDDDGTSGEDSQDEEGSDSQGEDRGTVQDSEGTCPDDEEGSGSDCSESDCEEVRNEVRFNVSC